MAAGLSSNLLYTFSARRTLAMSPFTAKSALNNASRGAFQAALKIFPLRSLRPLDCLADMSEEGRHMMVAAGLAVLVVFCLLLSMVQKPPAIGR